jgi:hypothetical protein
VQRRWRTAAGSGTLVRMPAAADLQPLRSFRTDPHHCFRRRADALFAAVSPPRLSLQMAHRRGRGSAYDALAEGWTAPLDVRRVHPPENANAVAVGQIWALLPRLPASKTAPLFAFDAGHDSAQLTQAPVSFRWLPGAVRSCPPPRRRSGQGRGQAANADGALRAARRLASTALGADVGEALPIARRELLVARGCRAVPAVARLAHPVIPVPALPLGAQVGIPGHIAVAVDVAPHGIYIGTVVDEE